MITGVLAHVTVISPLADVSTSYKRGTRKTKNYPICIGEDLSGTRLPKGTVIGLDLETNELEIHYPNGLVRHCHYPYCHTLARAAIWSGPLVRRPPTPLQAPLP